MNTFSLYNGTVDAAPISDTDTSAYYTINIAESGSYDVLVHFPTSQYATIQARYDVYVVDYLEGPAGEADLGSPALTAMVDQTDTDSYASLANEEGFVNIGSVDVEAMASETMTVVIKLSSDESSDSRTGASSSLLVSDAVMLEMAE